MIFIGVALLVAIGIALIISADAGSLVGLSEQQTGQLAFFVILLVFLASSLFTRRQRWGELMGNVLTWAAIFCAALIGYTYREDVWTVANRVMGELSPGAAVVDSSSGTAEFRRSLGGSFRLNAEVNGAPMTLIFDTGASAVVLTDEDARAAGIDTRRLSFSIPVQTANGTGRAALVRLNSISVGGITRRNIRAFVAEPHALETSLLGMTYLETLTHYGVSRDSLVLTD